eukprot:9455172-Alexandrium_andersonii.AAC.1
MPGPRGNPPSLHLHTGPRPGGCHGRRARTPVPGGALGNVGGAAQLARAGCCRRFAQPPAHCG